MIKNLPKLIVILGPTASGKTGLALQLAKKIDGQIISADSRQIYRGLDIGTDKAIDDDIPHQMIDVVNPDEEFSLAQYQQAVFQLLAENPQQAYLLVGGTGLYISAIVDNLQIPAAQPDKKLRKELETKNNKELLAELEKLDPVSAQKIDPQNKRRLIRALEVCRVTGQPFSQQTTKGESRVDALQIGLDVPREKLYEKIDRRVDGMIEEGLVEEVKNLLAQGYSKDLPALSGIGYQEIIRYLEKEISLTETTELIKKNTRHYAKRQQTWFKRDKRIKWVKDYQEAEKLVKHFLA